VNTDIRLKIADIVFSSVCEKKKTSELLNSESSYHSFLSNENPDIVVYGHHSVLPAITLRDKDRVFRSNIYWDVYRVEGNPVFVLRTDDASHPPYCIGVFRNNYTSGDVYYKGSYFEDIGMQSLPHPLTFPIFHLLMISLLSKGYGVLMHACGIDEGGRGVLFTGSSTHGKTTMARLWEKKAIVLNDERVVLRQKNGQFWIYGTPWHGEYGRISPHGVPLEKIFILRKGDENTATKLKNLDAASHLLKHCFLPYWDVDGMNFVVDFCAHVSDGVPCYELAFVPEQAVVDFVQCVK
jgi:hypothetical protein